MEQEGVSKNLAQVEMKGFAIVISSLRGRRR